MKRYRSFMSDYDCLQIALTVKLKTVGPGHLEPKQANAYEYPTM